jgi:hypothetical protein
MFPPWGLDVVDQRYSRKAASGATVVIAHVAGADERDSEAVVAARICWALASITTSARGSAARRLLCSVRRWYITSRDGTLHDPNSVAAPEPPNTR